MSGFINCATRWSGSDWICPIMGNSCIFHWETNVCFGDGLGNRGNLRRLYVYLLFHWYAEHVWNQWERKANISEESTCKHSLFPQAASLGSSQKLHKQCCAHTCTRMCTRTHNTHPHIHICFMIQSCPQPAWLQECFPTDPRIHFFAVTVTVVSPCLEVLKRHLDMVLGNQLWFCDSMCM